MSILPARYAMTAWKDATWDLAITVLGGNLSSSPTDFTDCTATMAIRPYPGGAPFYTLSTGNGRITLGGTTGTISLNIPSGDTLNLTSGVYELDVITENGTGSTDPILWGPFRVMGVA